MAHTTLPCFHAASLRQTFARQVAIAHSQRLIDQVQADRFNTLCEMPWPTLTELSVYRLECAALGDHPEFADALLLIENGVKTTEVYLCLPLCALERFASRQQFDAALAQRYGDGAVAPGTLVIEEQPLAGSLFEYWMANLSGRQEAFLSHLDHDLLALPSLQGVLHETLQATLQRLAAEQPSDPEQWLYQQAPRIAPRSVTHTRSLVEVAMDAFCHVEHPAGPQLTLLPPDGQTLPAALHQSLEGGIRSAIGTLAAHYEGALTRYWQADSRTAHAAMALRHGYYLALLDLEAQAQLSAAELAWLRLGLYAPALATLGIHRVALHSGQRAGVRLAAVLVFSQAPAANGPLFLFAPGQGLKRFLDQAALTHWLLADAQEALLHEAVGQENLAPLQQLKQPGVQLTAVTGAPFAERLASILEVQRGNLAIAIAQRGTRPAAVAVALDDAIDVRGLLAPALLLLDQSPRWAIGGPGATADGDSDVDLDNADTEPANAYGRLLALQARWATILEAVPTLESCVRHLLDLRLAILGDSRLGATSVWVTRAGAGREAQRDTLLVVALESMSTAAPPPLTAADAITGVDGQPLANLDHRLLNRWLQGTTQQVKGQWVAQFQRFNQHPTRLGALQLDAHRESLDIRQLALREEAQLVASGDGVDGWAKAWLEQLLARPRRSMRLGLGDNLVECNQVSLRLPDAVIAFPLTNVMALTQGTAPNGLAVLCSHRHGLLAFDTRAELASELNRLLDAPSGREQWLKLVAERYQPALRAHLEAANHGALQVSLSPGEDAFAQLLQRSDETRQIFTATYAFSHAHRAGYPAALALAYIDDAASGLCLGDQLDELALTLKARLLDQALPAWLRQASSADLDLYNHNLERLRTCLLLPKRFLFGVETASQFAESQVLTWLTLDFPEASIDLANIRVRVRQKFKSAVHFSGASEGLVTGSDGVTFTALELSLVQYSLHRFIAQPGIPLEVRMADGSPLLPGLSVEYVAKMADRLDTGGHYLRHLRELFAAQHAQYPERQALFRQQIPPTLMDAAIEGKLKGLLSQRAFDVVECLLDMPDPTARQIPAEQHWAMYPFSLRAADGLVADPAQGLFLLGAAPGTEGPVVLLAIFHEPFVLREYRDHGHLLDSLRAPGELQALVLQRLDPKVVARYAHGGLRTAHFELSAGPETLHPEPAPKAVQLTFEPVRGNTMDYLLDRALAFLLRAAEAQVVTSQQVDQAATLRLLQLLGETGLSFISGRLALALSAWQSEEWFHASAQSAWSQDWGRAVSEFIVALSIVLTHRLPRLERLGEQPLPVAVPHDPAATWRTGNIPLPVKAVLRSYEARDVSLAQLQHDAVTGTYHTAPAPQRYAPVAGHVYAVELHEGRWNIVENTRQGPYVRRNAQGYWELDTHWRLAAGGAGWSRRRAERTLQRVIAQDFITEAVGMPDVRRFYLDKALKIGSARLLAKRYLEHSLDALEVPAGQRALSATALDTLQKFFDVGTPPPSLIDAIKRQIGRIFAELMDASLNPHNSQRYIVGANRPGREAVLAFVDKKDPLRRIYFTDTFFFLPEQMRAMLRNSQKGFEAAEHFRATTLIHELSHLCTDTVDIAYVEASAPFIDLIDSTAPGPSGRSLLHDLHQFQNLTLTSKTPPGQLFKVREHNAWRDLDSQDGDPYTRVLRLTQSKDLATARRKFLTDQHLRSQVMLANADSVALLITLLARQPLAKAAHVAEQPAG